MRHQADNLRICSSWGRGGGGGDVASIRGILGCAPSSESTITLMPALIRYIHAGASGFAGGIHAPLPTSLSFWWFRLGVV